MLDPVLDKQIIKKGRLATSMYVVTKLIPLAHGSLLSAHVELFLVTRMNRQTEQQSRH